MLKQLQRKVILIVTFSLLSVMVVVMLTVNLINIIQMNQDVDNVLALLCQNDGQFPVEFLSEVFSQEDSEEDSADSPPEPKNEERNSTDRNQNLLRHMTEETAFETRFFSIHLNSAGHVSAIDTTNIAAISSNEALEYAAMALAKDKTSAYIGDYKYKMEETPNGTIIVFVDCYSELQTVRTFFLTSSGIALLSVLLVFIIVFFLSKRAIAPIAESLEKQKQFITDAGHELKTPISIISANTDVLELTGVKNQWTESIHNQTTRLTTLVRDLLLLSKMDEHSEQPIWTDFSFSDVVRETAASFETLAGSQEKRFTSEIAPDISFHGNKESLTQLVSILCDNAVKYTPEGGSIHLQLTSRGKTILLTEENDCAPLEDKDLNRLFDRFYRPESSRSRETGGYGIGLSIARAVVEQHKGKISAKKVSETRICFKVTL